ncbi:SM-like, degradation of cytoplasmic mRNAs and positively regulates transcription initiation, partial [Cladochytrium tenue]
MAALTLSANMRALPPTRTISASPANLVLQDTVERHYVDDGRRYGDEYRGLFVVRGENVVLIGEV